MTTEDQIYDILAELRPEVDFRNAGHFVEEGLLDSFDLVTLVAELDDRLQVSIPGTMILPEHFSSARAIASLLSELKGDA